MYNLLKQQKVLGLSDAKNKKKRKEEAYLSLCYYITILSSVHFISQL